MQVCSGIVVDGDVKGAVEELVEKDEGEVGEEVGGEVGGRLKFCQVLFTVARVKETHNNIKVSSG